MSRGKEGLYYNSARMGLKAGLGGNVYRYNRADGL